MIEYPSKSRTPWCSSWYDCTADDCQRGAAHSKDEEGVWFEPEKGKDCFGYIAPDTDKEDNQ